MLLRKEAKRIMIPACSFLKHQDEDSKQFFNDYFMRTSFIDAVAKALDA